jgi:hypothetical protein
VGAAAQDRLDAAEELAWIEGLGDIVIRAELEPHDAVDILATGGEHDDRYLRARAQLAAQRQAVFARQHQVEHQQVNMRALHDAAHFPAVGHRGGAKLVLLQILRQQAPDLTVIVHNQQVRALVHHACLLRCC